MSSDHFLLLITKQFSGTITSPEKDALQQLLQDADNMNRYKTFEKFWQQKSRDIVPDTEAALQKVLEVVNNEKPFPAHKLKFFTKKNAFVSAAAMAVVIASAVWMNWGSGIGSAKQQQTAKVTATDVVEKQNLKGTRSVITLADGSKVWLNADSRLKYPASFTGSSREVELSGEAFFDVAKNPQKPFIIHLSGGTVRVLGTSFNIKAYPEQKSIVTSVSTGRVAFIPKLANKETSSDTTFLTANLKAVYRIGSGSVKTIKTSATEDKAWTDGKLIFHSYTMEEIAVTMERYFGKQVVINDDEIKSYRLTGSFEDNTAEEILYYLSKIKPFTYKITETQIILSVVR